MFVLEGGPITFYLEKMSTPYEKWFQNLQEKLKVSQFKSVQENGPSDTISNAVPSCSEPAWFIAVLFHDKWYLGKVKSVVHTINYTYHHISNNPPKLNPAPQTCPVCVP
ncbi:uncharacterized protein [Bemisia tabaci]|uniref:uncharacterized protein n=1 Tax=Bemisia tabaci TaxID=7038 RepID=UPI003B283683